MDRSAAVISFVVSQLSSLVTELSCLGLFPSSVGLQDLCEVELKTWPGHCPLSVLSDYRRSEEASFLSIEVHCFDWACTF